MYVTYMRERKHDIRKMYVNKAGYNRKSYQKNHKN